MLNIYRSLKECIAVMIDHYQALFAPNALQSMDFVQGHWAALKAVHTVIIQAFISVVYFTPLYFTLLL